MGRDVHVVMAEIVDATIIHAPNSIKNCDQSRDPEMHQARKGKQWYFGMKAHVGADSKTKIIHTAVATAANVSDAAILPDLLHGEEIRVWGDGAYQEKTEVIREGAPRAQDYTQQRCRLQRSDCGRSCVGEKPDEVESAGQGRARVSGDEAEVRTCESALPGAEGERPSVVCYPRSGQPVCKPQETAAGGVTSVPLRMAKGG